MLGGECHEEDAIVTFPHLYLSSDAHVGDGAVSVGGYTVDAESLEVTSRNQGFESPLLRHLLSRAAGRITGEGDCA